MTGKEDAYETDMDEKTRPGTVRTNSSTEAEPDREQQEEVPHAGKERFGHGEPDLAHDEIESIVPGHELDVELGKVSRPLLFLFRLGRRSPRLTAERPTRRTMALRSSPGSRRATAPRARCPASSAP